MKRSELEEYFQSFRENTIGHDLSYSTPYGEQSMIYADWIASGRLYQAIENKLIDEIGGLEAAIMHIEKKTGIQNLDLEYYPIREEKLLDGIIPSIDNSAITNMLGKKLYYLYSPKF